MKTRIITILATSALVGALAASNLLAAGPGYGKRNGYGAQQQLQTQNKSQVHTQTHAQTRNQTQNVRPADSQRRDGTFLTTGVTANGSTSRPGYGKGVQDGSRLTTTGTPATETTP